MKIDERDPALIEMVLPRVSLEMIEALLKPYTTKEVKNTLFSIGDLKARGTDGLHVVFFRKCWHCDALTSEVLEAINNK